jgi:phage baseplate assembly protein W
MSTSDPSGRHLSFPFRIGSDGRTAAPATHSEHVHDELIQLILTSPGERLFLPDFGGGARKLVFEPTSDVLRGVTKARLTQAINKWLGHRVTLENLEVTFSGELVEVEIKYRAAGTEDSRIVKFRRTGQ